MYGQHHPISNLNMDEKYIGGLTLKQLGWVVGGGAVSIYLIGETPPLPFLAFPFNYVLQTIPLLTCVFLGFAKQTSTGLTYPAYWMSYFTEVFKTFPYIRKTKEGGK